MIFSHFCTFKNRVKIGSGRNCSIELYLCSMPDDMIYFTKVINIFPGATLFMLHLINIPSPTCNAIVFPIASLNTDIRFNYENCSFSELIGCLRKLHGSINIMMSSCSIISFLCTFSYLNIFVLKPCGKQNKCYCCLADIRSKRDP